MVASSGEEAARRNAVVEGLISIGIEDGVFHLMALDGQLLELKCETPRCYCEQGREYFPRPPVPDSDWRRWQASVAAATGPRGVDGIELSLIHI